MKHYVVTEYPGKVSLYIEDTASMSRQTIDFTWQEWSGLFWAVQDTAKHPNFKYREPTDRPLPHTKKQEPFVKHITLEEADASE